MKGKSEALEKKPKETSDGMCRLKRKRMNEQKM